MECVIINVKSFTSKSGKSYIDLVLKNSDGDFFSLIVPSANCPENLQEGDFILLTAVIKVYKMQAYTTYLIEYN